MVMIALFMLIVFTGCGKDIDGVWESYQYIDVDGTVQEKENLECTETFTISGDKINYTTSFQLTDKPIELKYTLVKNSDGTYNFVMPVSEGRDPLVIAENVKFDGDTMTMNVLGSTYIYKRQK